MRHESRGRNCVIRRHVLAFAVFAVLLGASLLASRAPADTVPRAVILNSSDADIEAEGCGDQECDEDEKSDEGFNSFDKRATANFKAAHGKIKAHSSQNTSLFAPSGELDRIVSRAAGDALYTQEPPDHRFSAFGGGSLDVELQRRLARRLFRLGVDEAPPRIPTPTAARSRCCWTRVPRQTSSISSWPRRRAAEPQRRRASTRAAPSLPASTP